MIHKNLHKNKKLVDFDTDRNLKSPLIILSMLRLLPFIMLVGFTLSISAEENRPTLKVLCWNIWRAGVQKEETGKPHQVAKIIKSQNPDLVAMQETYGSGPWLRKQLGYELKLRGPHLSLFSKHPILKDLSVGGEWNCIGALIDVPDFGKIAFFSIWLPFNGDIWIKGSRKEVTKEKMLAVCEPSYNVLSKMLPEIENKLKNEGLSKVPIIFAGDFNSMSHFDYVKKAGDQYGGWEIEWPTSKLMIDAGFTDTYRALHPKINRQVDRTWSPEFTTQEAVRIDFIYSRGEILKPIYSNVIDKNLPFFPSDHAIVITDFEKN